jgi:hypothetical protein
VAGTVGEAAHGRSLPCVWHEQRRVGVLPGLLDPLLISAEVASFFLTWFWLQSWIFLSKPSHGIIDLNHHTWLVC